jgi:hypothetical protein
MAKVVGFYPTYQSSILCAPTIVTILKHIAMLFRGSDEKESSVFQYGSNAIKSGAKALTDYPYSVILKRAKIPRRMVVPRYPNLDLRTVVQ